MLLFADTVSAPGWPADGLVQGTERNRFQAMEHLLSDSGTRARGNPRLMPALENAAGFLTDPVRPSILVLITSGDIGNEDMIAASFTPRAAAIHVHTIGIGAAVNTGLLRRLAAAGRGEMLLVEKQEALDDLAPNIRRLLGPPFLTQLSLAGAGFQLLTNTISPSRPPDIFSGISSVITGRFRGQPNGSVMVSGTGIDGRPWASRVDAAPVNGRALTQLWARAFLADLQHKYLRCQIHEADGLERLIVTTSLRFGVLTRLTAFVAVSNAATRATSAPRQVIQSVELPADWTEPELGLSAYAVEYERILASTRDRPAGQGAPDAEPARPTARTTAKPTADYAPPTWATTGSAPLPAPMPARAPAAAAAGRCAEIAQCCTGRLSLGNAVQPTQLGAGLTSPTGSSVSTGPLHRRGCRGRRGGGRNHDFRSRDFTTHVDDVGTSWPNARHDEHIGTHTFGDSGRPPHRRAAGRLGDLARGRQPGQRAGIRHPRGRPRTTGRGGPGRLPPPNR